MGSLRIPLRAVFYRESGRWVAHCLEFDLCGDGETLQEAFDDLNEAITIQLIASVEHKNLANLFSPADGKYFAMFAAGKNAAIEGLTVAPPTQVDHVTIEGIEAREYDLEGDDAETDSGLVECL